MKKYKISCVLSKYFFLKFNELTRYQVGFQTSKIIVPVIISLGNSYFDYLSRNKFTIAGFVNCKEALDIINRENLF